MTAATILVADDDSAIRTVLHQALARAGYNVRTTGTAAGLWKMIAAGEGSVAITDVMLPDESGFDLIPRIKRLRPELPVLVMSAQNTLLTAITAAQFTMMAVRLPAYQAILEKIMLLIPEGMPMEVRFIIMTAKLQV